MLCAVDVLDCNMATIVFAPLAIFWEGVVSDLSIGLKFLGKVLDTFAILAATIMTPSKLDSTWTIMHFFTLSWYL